VGKIAENLKISLPALAGLQLTPKAVTSTDPDANGVNQFMGIFATIGVPKPLRAFQTSPRLEARLARMELPPTREFAVTGRGSARPTAYVHVDGDSDLEYTWAVDGGVWHQFVAGPELAIADPQMWLQGRHFVDVRARRAGEVQLVPGPPARVDFIVDTIAPAGGFDVAGSELRVDVEDNVSPAELVAFRWAAAGGDFGAWLPGARTTLPAGIDPAALRVEARDEAGNVGDLGFHGRSTTPTGKGCGCDLGAHDDGSSVPSLVVVAALALLLARRRAAARALASRRVALGAVTALALVAAAGACNHGGAPLGKGDLANPDGEIGRFSDVVVDRNDALHLSAYDDTMGDLVYVRLESPDAAPAWQVIDGVDLTATPETKDGYRHGIIEPGPDVGLYTSIAVNSHNDPRIAYYDATAGALKYAIGPHPFTTMTVDAPASGGTKAGLHAALSLGKNDAPAIAYVVTGIASNNGFKSELRVARASKDKPGAGDWTIATVDSTPITCAGLCDASSACVVATMVNGMPNTDPLYSSCVRVDSAACPTACSDTQECIQGVCTNVLAPPGAPDLTEGIGLFVNARRNGAGKLVLVYYDHVQGDLKLAVEDDGGNFALSFLDGQNAATDVGQFASARLDKDDSIHVAYVDAFSDRLIYKHIAGGTVPAMAELIDDGVRGDGAHSVGGGANLILDGNGAPRVVYQDQTTADLQLATRPSGWSHAPANSGAAGFGFYPHQVLVKGKVWVTEFVYDRANSGGASFGSLRVSAP
jgi:hypothetical protein